MGTAKGGLPQRPAVTRKRAIDAAVALADAHGIGALSMRAVAGELGLEAMSLYHYFKGKGDMINGMVESAVSEIALPTDGAHWTDALSERASSSREVLRRHPWAISLINSETTAATLRFHDSILKVLRTSGCSISMAGHAMSLVDSYVYGFVRQEASPPVDGAGSAGTATRANVARQAAMTRDFPHFSAIATAVTLKPGYAYSNEFHFGLDLILRGLADAEAGIDVWS